MKIKSARELYEISKKQSPILVKKILDGVKEHCVERCLEEANSGSTYYSIYLKQTRSFAKELLLNECIKLVKTFEDNGYKVSIDDNGNGYYINFIITFSWDDNVRCREYHKRHLYDTDNGIIVINLDGWDDEDEF